MAETEKTEKTAFLLTGIDELSPKLAGLRVKIDGFKKNLEQVGIGKLDISGLFKGGSVITPFVDGIKASAAFQGKLDEVGESAKKVDLPAVPGSAVQNMNVFSASMAKVSGAIDAALVPAVGALVVGLEPLLTNVGSLLNDNPKLVEGLAAGAIAFSAMQTAVTGATQVFDLMSMVLKTNPIMLIAMGIAVAAGLIVANWEPISAFFSRVWGAVKGAAESAFAVFRGLLNWSPLEALRGSWGAITGYMSQLWGAASDATAQALDNIKAFFDWSPMALLEDAWGATSEFFQSLWQSITVAAAPLVDFFKTLFSWSPLGIVIDNWQPLTGLFSAIWDLLRALSVPVTGFLKKIFDWTPLGMVIRYWQPLLGFFSALWDRLVLLTAPVVDFFKSLFDWSPMPLIRRVWDPLSNYFSQLWQSLEAMAQPIAGFFRALFDWSPMPLISAVWDPLSSYFSQLWQSLEALAQPIGEFFRALFDWSPMPLINAAWVPVREFFTGLWDSLLQVTAPVKELFKSLFDWSPMEMIAAHWEPITEWFSGLWEKLKGIMAPIKEMLGGSFGGFIAKITGQVEGLTQAQQKTNAEGKGELAPAFFGADAAPLSRNLPQGSNALVQQSAANNRTQLEGGLTVRFENAPAGMRTDQPQINQPGLSLTPRIGYRSLSLGGSNELA